MIVRGVHHVTLGVSDLARARQFYMDILGLEEIPRPPFDFAGAWFRAGDQQIHLIVQPSVESVPDSGDINTRRRHVALRVPSYRETREHLRRFDVPCVDRPRNKTPWPQIYVMDPDGNLIELSADVLD